MLNLLVQRLQVLNDLQQPRIEDSQVNHAHASWRLTGAHGSVVGDERSLETDGAGAETLSLSLSKRAVQQHVLSRSERGLRKNLREFNQTQRSHPLHVRQEDNCIEG